MIRLILPDPLNAICNSALIFLSVFIITCIWPDLFDFVCYNCVCNTSYYTYIWPNGHYEENTCHVTYIMYIVICQQYSKASKVPYVVFNALGDWPDICENMSVMIRIGLWCLTVLSTIFQLYNVPVRNPMTCCKSLTHVFT